MFKFGFNMLLDWFAGILLSIRLELERFYIALRVRRFYIDFIYPFIWGRGGVPTHIRVPKGRKKLVF